MRKVEELGVSILGSLFKFCTGERLDRLVLKFGENECEKVDRLCELYCRYSDKLQALDSRYAAADAARAQHPRWLAASEEEKASLLEEVAEERYLERLDAGLYTMQLLAALLASIWVRLLGQPPKPNITA
jgi:beta-catenin-like protein 1